MIIAQYLPVKISNIYSEAINSVSAYLMIKLFQDNIFDENFTNYLQIQGIQQINYEVIDRYINIDEYESYDETQSDL